jgi:hypothetical protein
MCRGGGYVLEGVEGLGAGEDEGDGGDGVDDGDLRRHGRGGEALTAGWALQKVTKASKICLDGSLRGAMAASSVALWRMTSTSATGRRGSKSTTAWPKALRQ